VTARLAAVTSALAALVITGCGGNRGIHKPDPGALPLAPGSRVVAQTTRCDPGSNPYCAVELVVVNPRYRDSGALVVAERRTLARHNWIANHASNGDEHAADSPGDGLRVTYATAFNDLKDIELGWITRARPISVVLSRVIFQRSAALSVMLEVAA
jgi:hypothetical protein